MTVLREWFAEWAQAYYLRRGYDPVNRAINVLGALLVVGAVGFFAVDALG
jgi:hypothetical protein